MADDGTFATTAEIVVKAGLNASAVSSAEAYTNQYIKEVEGRICMLLRYDLVTNYTLINAVGKEFLRNAASDYAAYYVLEYSTASIASTEAQTRLNQLWNSWVKAETILKDQDTKAFLLSS